MVGSGRVRKPMGLCMAWHYMARHGTAQYDTHSPVPATLSNSLFDSHCEAVLQKTPAYPATH